jgi:hypothetical protein
MPSYDLLLDTPWIVGSTICLAMTYSYFLKLHNITYMPTNSAQFAMANLRLETLSIRSNNCHLLLLYIDNSINILILFETVFYKHVRVARALHGIVKYNLINL